MPHTFLGKPIPKQTSAKKAPRKKRRGPSFAWGTLLVLPIVACGTLLALQKTSLQPGIAERSTGGALVRTFAVAPTPTPTPLAPATPYPNPCDVNIDKVRNAFLDPATNTLTNIFPIIPDDIGVNSSFKCTPSYWNRAILYLFIYKGLGIFNWIAEAAAILITLYAGILYMTAIYSEGNAKTAKAWLIGAYGGLIIVLLAKTLVFSAISLAIQDNPYDVLTKAPPIPGLPTDVPGATPTPTP